MLPVDMTTEVKKALEEVALLREQKKSLQHELSELFAFKARQLGGAPDRPSTAPGPQQQQHPPIHFSNQPAGPGRGMFNIPPPIPAGRGGLISWCWDIADSLTGGFAGLWGTGGPRLPGRAQ
jgi:hypothetical protein